MVMPTLLRGGVSLLQYFEVDLAYLRSRQAHLTWITKALTAIPTEWPIIDVMCAENDLTGEDKEEDDASWIGTSAC
jgi:hypothetical protein